MSGAMAAMLQARAAAPSAVPVIASSTGFQNAGSTTLVMTKPSSLAVGDLLLVYFSYSRGGSGSPTVPSGWTVPSNGSIAYSDPPSQGCLVAYKIADSGDVAASNFTFDSTGGSAFSAEGIIQRITGAHATTPIDVAANQSVTTTTTGTYPSVTTTGANRLVQLFGWKYYGSTTASGSQFPNVVPSGTTAGTNSNYVDGVDNEYAGSAYFTQASAGATGSKNVTVANIGGVSNTFRGITVAVSPP